MMPTIPLPGGSADSGNVLASKAEPIKDAVDDILMLSAIREEGKAELIDLLDALRGRKCLIVDTQLAGLMNQMLVDGPKVLKENGVQYFRELDSAEIGDFMTDGVRDVPENIIYLVRSDLAKMNVIAQQILAAMRNGIRSQFHIYFVPTQATVCMHLLEEKLSGSGGGGGSGSAWDKVSFGEFRMGLVPYDSDLLSLEMDHVFKQCYVDGDLSSLNVIALALLKLQFIFGIIPNVRSKGLGARKVLQKMMRLRVEEEDTERQQAQLNGLLLGGGGVGADGALAASSGAGSTAHLSQQRSEIDTLVILDREVDLVSPLVTPLTYEGLIDDTLGIDHGRITVDASVVGSADQQDALSAKMAAQAAAASAPGDAAAAAASAAASAAAASAAAASKAKQPEPGEKVPVILNSSDGIYAEIRDLSIESLGAFLQEKAVDIRRRYTTFKQNKDASLVEIHDFVKKIPQLTREFKALNQHINIASLLKQRTDSRDFRDQWQGERCMLEGEGFLEGVEEILVADTQRTQLQRVLRLLCMQSLTAGGVRASRYDSLRKMIAQIYGFQHLLTLGNLERSGLIRRRDALIVVESGAWQNLRKLLRLIDDNVSMTQPNDVSYVSAGYAPLLVRLVQSLGLSLSPTRSGGGVGGGGGGGDACSWAGILEAMKLLPGPMLEFSQLHSRAEELTDALNRSASEAAANAGGGGSGGGGAGSGSSSSSGGGSSSSSSGAFGSVLSYTTGIMSSTAVELGGGGGSRHKSMSSAGASLFDPEAGSGGGGGAEGSNALAGLGGGSQKKVMLVFVVGGLSFIEIAAFRFLSKDPTFPYKLVLATTKLISGNSFLQSLQHHI